MAIKSRASRAHKGQNTDSCYAASASEQGPGRLNSSVKRCKRESEYIMNIEKLQF